MSEMMPENKKLFLLDAFALIYRAYYALIKNPMYNSKGINTSAIYGFTNTLIDLLRRERPSHIAVVFDTSAPTSRHIKFEAYKAHREAMPEDISSSLPYIKRMIKAFNIPVMEKDGYEADDVIGTLAKKAERHGYKTYMITPDKDFAQLVSDNIFMYKPARNGEKPEVMGVNEVCKKFEITDPLQVIDILGLMGDAADNIPGIPGIGEKTAKKLITEFGSIETLLNNTDKLKGKLKESIEQNVDMAILSKDLAKIICDAPVEFDEIEFLMKKPDMEALRSIFTELEFRRLAERIFSELTGEPSREPQEVISIEKPKSSHGQQTDLFGDFMAETSTAHELRTATMDNIQTVEHYYHLVDTPEKITELKSNLLKQKSICFDTETTGIDALQSELVGLSFSYKPKEGFYIPVPENFENAKKIAGSFREILENDNIEKIGQNIKYDILVLKKYGVKVAGPMFDTMLAHYIIQPDMRHNMNVLAETYLNYSPVPIETLIGKKGKRQLSMRSAPLEKITEYACEDADITLKLKEIFVPMLESSGSKKIFVEIEMPLVPVLADIENEGVKIDTGFLKHLSVALNEDIMLIEKDIHQLAGFSFNIDSPKQLGDVLFDMLKIDEKPKKTKTGQYSTSEDILSRLVHKHSIVGKILDFRSLRKLKSTYVDALPEMVNIKTGRIHSSFNQAVASTGRLSSDNPNLQNIPIRTERGREIRKAFVPKNEDYLLLSADYSQIELRIIAELSKDEGMMQAFRNGLDIHAATASKVFGTPVDNISKEMRIKAKAVNFGISYGQGAFGLSQTLNIPRGEAKEIIDNFFKEFPGIRTYMGQCVAFAREKGYVETIMGRKRYLKDINSANAIVRGQAERNAVNAPIQGSAADMIKIAMINIHRELLQRKLQTKMILQVHDELIFDVFRDEMDEVKELVEKMMKSAIKMSVPLEIDIHAGANWLEAH